MVIHWEEETIDLVSPPLRAVTPGKIDNFLRHPTSTSFSKDGFSLILRKLLSPASVGRFLYPLSVGPSE